ncbi:hypothetical protein RQP53_15080 [Paucibacter sp. APW11]|uniref:Uncharacterized protein n=1 Tax=Roseateles aquae TaxID=3077235 RepID=A0ABU3PDE4_9BURK|nr:hypothetical protein [Paucibacter sp. APW11]MDT9000596.1 hypothetical protein [Paucibacter sp. APW11]
MDSADSPKQPALQEPTLGTVRQLYTEAQQWTRHYEQLIVSGNTVIISAAAVFVGMSMGEQLTALQSRLLLIVPFVLAVVGILLTLMLFRLYASSIARLIRYEGLLGCFDPALGQALDAKGSLLPGEMQRLPVAWPASVRFFVLMHGALAIGYLVLMVLRKL